MVAMQKRYEAKHCDGYKVNSISKIFAVVIVMIMYAFNTVGGILAYFTSEDASTNQFTLAGTYTVIYDANTGSGSMPNQKIFCGYTTTLHPNTYTKTLHFFDGWNTDPNGNGTSYSDEASVTDLAAEDGTIYLYAQWVENLGVAEIDGEYFGTLAAALATVKKNKATTIKLLRDVDESFTLSAGYNVTIDLQGHTLQTGTDRIENKGHLTFKNGTLTKISSITHAVVNNNSGATLEIIDTDIISHGSTKSQAVYNNGGSVTISGNCTLTSESTDRATVQNNAGTMQILGGTIISENFHAVVNGGSSLIIGTQGGGVDTTSPVLQGYNNGLNSSNNNVTFYDGIIKGKSNATNNDNNIQYKEGGCSLAQGTEVIGNYTYKTRYLEPNNTITFDPTGGTVSDPIRYYDTNDTLGTLPTPTWEGHVFEGWYTDPDYGTIIDDNTLVTGDDTYYAHWRELCLIQFNPNSGTVDEPSRYVENGAQIGTLPVPTRTKHRFDGWFTERDGGTQIFDTTTITQSATYYAHWTEACEVTFDPNGGKVTERIREVLANEQIGALPTPTKSENTFVGWFTERNGGTQISASTVVTADITYYAHWTGTTVARMNGVEYGKLQDAIDDAPDNTQTTIELLSNVSEHINVTSTKNIVLDVGSYTLSNRNNNAAVIENDGTLHIINGTITSSAGYATINNNPTGNLIITGGTLSGTGTRQPLYNNGGYIEISGTAYLTSGPNVATERERGTIFNYAGTVVIKGGTVVAEEVYAVLNGVGATVTIGEDDGSVSTTSPIMQGVKGGIKNQGTLNFYDGIVKAPQNKTTITGTINDSPTGYTIVSGTEVIDGTNYNTSYLEVNP